jgi:2-alkyl-3-oxoalkanoate reductase
MATQACSGMNLTIAVVGATGVLGRNVIPRLVERGYAVRALVRDAAAGDWLRSLGAQVVVGNILAPETLPPLLESCATAVHLATAVPRPGRPRDFSMNDRIRREGTRNLLSACGASGVRRYLQQSIAMLQGGIADQWTDEAGEPSLTPITQSAWDMEQMVRNSRLDWLILRGGLFYGPGTGLDAAWREAARRGTLTMPGDGRRFVSLVHVSDMAEALACAIDAPSRQALAVTDDHPIRYAELFSYIAALEAGPAPRSGGPERLASFRVPNKAVKSALGWMPHYRSVRSGLT